MGCRSAISIQDCFELDSRSLLCRSYMSLLFEWDIRGVSLSALSFFVLKSHANALGINYNLILHCNKLFPQYFVHVYLFLLQPFAAYSLCDLPLSFKKELTSRHTCPGENNTNRHLCRKKGGPKKKLCPLLPSARKAQENGSYNLPISNS